MAQAQSENQTIRINLVENASQRFYEATPLGTSSGIVGIGIVGIMIVGGTTVGSKDVRMINVIPTIIINPYQKTAHAQVSKRPGFAVLNTPGTEAGNAIRVWLGQGTGIKVMSMFGNTNSTLYDGTTSKGAITGLARDITETFVGTVATLVIPSSDSTAWYYPDAGALTQITDVDYPGNAGLTTTGTFVHLDGYAFIMTTDGRIWNSDLNSVTAWTSTSVISAQLSPDKGIGLARYKNRIVAFGKESIEFFENVANPTGSPLQRIPELFIKIGSPNQNLITNIEDTIIFVGSSSTGSYGVYMLDNYQAKKVSYSEIDSLLSLVGIGQFTASAVRLWGKPLYILHSSNRTYIYSPEDELWFEWNSAFPLWYKVTGDTSENIYSISNSTAAAVVGKVFNVNQNVIQYQDNGSNFTMAIQTSKIDLGNNKRKKLSRLHIIGNKNATTNNLDISYTDDDYQNYSVTKTIDLASNYQYLNNLGMFRRRSFLLANSSDESTRLESIDLDYVQGNN
jgi:stabilization protein